MRGFAEHQATSPLLLLSACAAASLNDDLRDTGRQQMLGIRSWLAGARNAAITCERAGLGGWAELMAHGKRQHWEPSEIVQRRLCAYRLGVKALRAAALGLSCTRAPHCSTWTTISAEPHPQSPYWGAIAKQHSTANWPGRQQRRADCRQPRHGGGLGLAAGSPGAARSRRSSKCS